MKVFLSHSSADNDLARRLARDLLAAGVDVWLDEWEVGVGEQFAQKIEQGLVEVEFVIVLLTSASVTSEWVNREWRSKIQHEARTRRIALVPVRGEPCEIPDFLAQRSYADISGGSYPLGFRHLLTILLHYSDGTSINVPVDTIERQQFSDTMLPIVTPIALEVSNDLIPLFEPDNEGANRALDELAPRMRADLHAELGFLFPGVRVRGNEFDMPPRSALILIDEVPEVMIEVGGDQVLVDGSVEQLATLGIRGEPRDDPATGRARARIAVADRTAAEAAGLTTWDAAEYLFLALQVVLRQMASSFLDIDVTRRLVDSIEATASHLVADTVPKAVSWFELTDILQRLVDEGIGVGDIGRILEALSQRVPGQGDTVTLTERVRHALNRNITAKFARGRDSVPVFLLDPEIEALIGNAIQRTPVGAYLGLAPQISRDIVAAVRVAVDSLGDRAVCVPIVVTDEEVRPFVRKLVSLEFPALHVLSRQDLAPDTLTPAVARIQLGSTPHRTAPGGEGPPG